jgi:hypothetical protein
MLPLVSSSITLSQVFVDASNMKGLVVMLIPVTLHAINCAVLLFGSISVLPVEAGVALTVTDALTFTVPAV